jgi:small subunit ribosomal protein S9
MIEEETPRDDETTEEPQNDAPEAPAAEADAEASADAELSAEPEQDAPEPEAAESPEQEAAPESPEPEAAESPEPPEDAPASEASEPAQPEAEAPAPGSPEESEAVAAEEPAGEPAGERPQRERKKRDKASEPEVIPGAHLEPDLVLEEAPPHSDVGEQTAAEIQAAEEALAAQDGATDAETETEAVPPEPSHRATTVLEFAADARYRATGKRKSAVARITLKPGTGSYMVNGRELDRFFPRPTLQKIARGPLETVGQEERMDVVAQIHGGGVSAQAGALRHGVAKALVEADPNLRGELKRRGFLTRDPRVKERKKAGLKKARKRPQFSKR